MVLFTGSRGRGFDPTAIYTFACIMRYKRRHMGILSILKYMFPFSIVRPDKVYVTFFCSKAKLLLALKTYRYCMFTELQSALKEKNIGEDNVPLF